MERVRYDINPIYEVILQLRFPPILAINAKDPVEFQESIRKQFPIYQLQISNQQELTLKMMISPYLNDGSFSYERSSLTHNQFHGNLLVKTDLSKHERATIQQSLVMLASHNEIVPNPNV